MSREWLTELSASCLRVAALERRELSSHSGAVTIFTHNVTHNAGSHFSENSLNSCRSFPYVVCCALCTHNILYLAGLATDYEFHLYYDI